MVDMPRTPADRDPARSISTIGPETFRRDVQQLVGIYLAAMDYPREIAAQRTALWVEHSRRIGFDARIARDADGSIAGLAYGYHGAPGQWWFSEIARGLGSPTAPVLRDFFELTELHVRPDRQGSGLGEALLRSLAAPRPERWMLLSTPEGENRAWRLYRRLGFGDVLRHYRFTGDARPFGILGRELPLADADAAGAAG